MAVFAAHADMSHDKAITDQVKSAIVQHPDVGTGVSTKDGVEYLKGKTTTPLAKTHAEELAKGVPGVAQVVDDIATER
jgi:osmotically-inducible protein OsmY